VLGADGKPVDIGKWYGGNAGDFTLKLDNYYACWRRPAAPASLHQLRVARYGLSADPVAAPHTWPPIGCAMTMADQILGIGNETYGSWGGGLFYRHDEKPGPPALPGHRGLVRAHVKVFADSMRAAARETGATIYIGATLYQQALLPATSARSRLTSGVLANAGATADYFIVHNYFTAYKPNSSIAISWDVLVGPFGHDFLCPAAG